MADRKTPKEIAEQYLAALRGETDFDYLDMWHDDITYTLPGLWPLGGVYTSKQDYLKSVQPDFEENVVENPEPVVSRPGMGLYGYEYISEGNTIVVLARSRSRDSRGKPYTNTFFLWFDLDDDGKIINYLDFADFSSGWQAFWGYHLE